MKVILIRHAKTYGNTKKRYIGSTDEDICYDGEERLKEIILENDLKKEHIDKVYASPMIRCLHTAKILYPDNDIIEVKDFRECDFGDFENKNYMELKDNKDYKKWLKYGYIESFPNGENVNEFKNRSLKAFSDIVKDCKKKNINTIACVVHGGTIMSIMEKFEKKKKDYYEYNCKNGGGYVCNLKDFDKNISLEIDKQW